MHQGQSREWSGKKARADASALRPNMLALMVSMAGAVMAVAPGAASAQPVAAQEARLSFALQAQPLLSALRAFGLQTQSQVLFHEALLAGREAVAVYGAYTPQEALELLLARTGLTIATARPRSFTLKAAQTGPQASGLLRWTVPAITIS